MSSKAVAWALLAAMALAAVLIFNYWAAHQPLSTLVYSGIVMAVAGLANLIVPFRFLGVRKRTVGALLLVGGVALALGALSWPARTIRVAQHQSVLDDTMPEYQFAEKHSTRIHARPEQVLQAVRESTFGDMKCMETLLKIRATALHLHDPGPSLADKRVLDVFSASGYVTGGNAQEVVMYGGANAREKRGLGIHNVQEFVTYREPGAVKMAYNFAVEDAGGGWTTISTETRVLATDDPTRRGMERYWRLIVPGSGLLRRQWLDAIRRRAESMGEARS
jgi:hypothetical protein